MYQDQIIDLIWDNSSQIDSTTMGMLTKAGLRPHALAIGDIPNHVSSKNSGPCVVCIHGRDQSTIELIEVMRSQFGSSLYIVLRLEGAEVDLAVEAVKVGVDDVISADMDCQSRWDKVADLARVRLIKNDSYVFVDETSQHLLALVERVGASEVTALMHGPTGSGKEVLARLTHDFSPRRSGPFIPVNCAALPESLAESLLFGHTRGAFTGATRSTDGFFTQAHGGTLFLDEIGELTLPLQAKLLRAIQEREIIPVGSSESSKVDVRIVAATNLDLRSAIRVGTFREDLYFRVSTFRINVPGLKSRLDDILPLANFFLVKHGSDHKDYQLSPEASSKLLSYAWPGNVRELENVIQRAIVLSSDGSIDSTHLIFDELIAGPETTQTPFGTERSVMESPFDRALRRYETGHSEVQEDSVQTNSELTEASPGLQGAMDANEFRIIVETIKNTRTRKEAADVLGISQRTLRYKIARMREKGISVPKRQSA